MEIMVAKDDHQESTTTTATAQEHQQLQEPLLLPPSSHGGEGSGNHLENDKQKPTKTRTQKAIRKTFKNTTRLTNLLPTGSVLAFEILSPAITTNDPNHCNTRILKKTAAWVLVILCSLSCFLACFIDSIHDARGKVRYGFATWQGLWVVDGSVKLDPNEGGKYRIRAMDFVHGFMSVLVFAGVVMFNEKVIGCLFRDPSDEMEYTLTVLTAGIGVFCSLFFVWFPSKRHGVTNPLSRV